MSEQQERDERAIEKVLRIYALAMDARRWDLFDSIFTQDVRANYPSAQWTDVQTFKKDFAAQHAGFDATQHAVMTPVVEVDGDEAASFAYVSFRLIRRGTPGGDFLEGQAWYDDRFVRTPKGWRIGERNCRILWSDGNPAAAGGRIPMEWHPMRIDAAEGKVGLLNLLDKRLARI
jgi:hypothetical protein